MQQRNFFTFQSENPFLWMPNKFLKIILLLAGMILISSHLSAINYQFTASSGVYTANAGTNIWTSGDDNLSAAIPIGFTFNFGGCTTIGYTQVEVSTNGWLALGTAATGSQATNDMAWTVNGPLLAPLWDDLAIGTGGNVNYSTTGVVGSRIFTVEWLNMKWNWGAGSAGISFQIKLYEADGKIEYKYRQETGALSSASASIGINGGAAGDYYSLNNSGASPTAVYGTATNNLNAKPATGQIYTWTLPTTMTYVSSTTSQASIADVYQGTTNQEIVRLDLNISGGCTPFNLTQILLNMTGTSSLGDVTNVDVYYTGTSSVFSASTLFGSVAPAGGTLTVNGNQVLQNGINYFWIVYDISATAVVGNLLDAQCTQITMTLPGGTQTPTVTNPAGSRPIVATPPSFSKWIELGWAKSVIEENTASGIIWAGLSNNTYTAGNSDAYIVKTNYDLSTIYWTSVIGNATGSERIEDITQTSDGFVAVGTSNMPGGAGGYDIFVMKINSTGVVQWTKLIGTTGTDYGYSVCNTSDGNVAICGELGDFTDGFFAKIDNSNGNILVQRRIDATNATRLYTLTQTSDGGFLLGGQANTGDFYLAKLTAAYAFEWGRYWGGINTDKIEFVLENGPNDYVAGGWTYSYGMGGSDGYAMRFSWTGAAISVNWVETIGTTAGDGINDGMKTADGNFVFSGLTTRLGDPTNNEAFIAKINAAGSNVFMKSVGTLTISEDEEGYGIAPLSDGTYAMAGLHNNVSGANFYMVKFSSAGYNCAAIQDNGSTMALLAPTFTTSGAISTPAFAPITPTPVLNTGGVIAPDGCVTLPIELTGFEADCKNRGTELFWGTASETNNSFFTVEKSDDGINFYEVGIVDGAGNSSMDNRYFFFDEDGNKKSYYKLRQTDFNGNHTYSRAIFSDCESDAGDGSLVVFPNPFTNSFSISIPDYLGEEIQITITDAIGKICFRKKWVVDRSVNSFDFGEELSNGIYILYLDDKKSVRSQKIIRTE